jgi:flagellin-like protein
MKLPTPNDSDRGQVGIGTLIIFIALVLVAAVAAGVLVNTAGELQTRASDTGSDAQTQVSNQIDVVSATGDTTDSSGTVSGQVRNVTLVVKKSPGSDPIDLRDATIEYTSADNSSTLVYADTADPSNFTTNNVTTTGTVLDNTRDRIEIEIDLPNELEEDESAELKIVDQSGATTTYGIDVPEVLNKKYIPV